MLFSIPLAAIMKSCGSLDFEFWSFRLRHSFGGHSGISLDFVFWNLEFPRKWLDCLHRTPGR